MEVFLNFKRKNIRVASPLEIDKQIIIYERIA